MPTATAARVYEINGSLKLVAYGSEGGGSNKLKIEDVQISDKYQVKNGGFIGLVSGTKKANNKVNTTEDIRCHALGGR